MSDIQSGITILAVMFLLGGSGYTAFWAVGGILNRIKGGTSSAALQDAINAVLPYVNKGIAAAMALELKAWQEADRQLTDIELSGIANKVYSLIPDVVHLGIIPIPVKVLISADMFAALVKKTYDETHAFILANETYLSPSAIPAISAKSTSMGTPVDPTLHNVAVLPETPVVPAVDTAGG